MSTIWDTSIKNSASPNSIEEDLFHILLLPTKNRTKSRHFNSPCYNKCLCFTSTQPWSSKATVSILKMKLYSFFHYVQFSELLSTEIDLKICPSNDQPVYKEKHVCLLFYPRFISWQHASIEKLGTYLDSN